MRIFECFLRLKNGVTAKGCVPARTHAEAYNYVLANLNVTPSQVASLEVHRV